jgi:hypothetical protein
MKLLALILVMSVVVGCAHHNHHGGKSRAKRVHVSSVVVPVAPPKALLTVKGVKPHAHSSWQQGYWHWNGEKYVWLDGKWATQGPDKVWVAGRWKHHKRGWVWVNGRWG